jgi:hypothetical protein
MYLKLERKPMSWESVKLSDIKEESRELPKGNYTFQIAPKSAGYKRWTDKTLVECEPDDSGALLCIRLTVVDGEQKGKAYFLQFQHPDSFDNDKSRNYMLQGYKKFVTVLGVEQKEGETKPEFFNRVAEDHGSRFTADITGPESYKDKKTGEQKVGRSKLLAFSVKPAV